MWFLQVHCGIHLPIKITILKIYAARQVSRAKTSFTALGRDMQLISGPPYTETEQLSKQTLLGGFLATRLMSERNGRKRGKTFQPLKEKH